MREPTITAVLVAWNSGSMLEACVGSLRDSAEAASVELEVVVIDNDSSDGSVASLALRDGDRVVRNPVNAGFSVAATQGIALATAPWVMLVNPDLIVARELIGALAESARTAPADVATLVPEMRYAGNPELVNCRGITMDAAGIPAEVDAGTRGGDARPHRPDVLGGSSGCCLLRLRALTVLGGIEPCFFAYLEDVDLAVRLQRAGFRALVVPGAIAWHEGSATTGEGSPLKTYLVARNRRLLFRLDAPRSFQARSWRALAEIGHALVSTRGRARRAPWQGRLAALRLRRYTGFVLRSRHLTEPPQASLELPTRVGLRTTLARKRALAKVMSRF